MKLSTFILLLEGKAFFPSVATLRSGDPLEGDHVCHELELCSCLQAAGVGGNAALFAWLQDKASAIEEALLKDSTEELFNSKVLADVYIRELAKRRAVWCWFQESHESAAMWSIYANAGIAVRTCFQALEQALPLAVNFQIGRIHYRSRHQANAPVAELFQRRPHLIKGEEYKHENEVRITTACLPDEPGKVVALSNITTMIKEVVISPLLPFGEAEAVISMMNRYDWHGATVRRSSILGPKVEQEQSAAVIDEHFRELLDAAEPGLPPPLDCL